MLLGAVPTTEPQDVLGCGRNMAYRTAFGLVCIPELECPLHPCVEVMLVLLLQGLLHLLIGVPVKASDEILILRLAGQARNALLLRFVCQSLFNLPPWALDCDFIGQEQFGLRPDPPHELGWLPSPFL